MFLVFLDVLGIGVIAFEELKECELFVGFVSYQLERRTERVVIQEVGFVVAPK